MAGDNERNLLGSPPWEEVSPLLALGLMLDSLSLNPSSSTWHFPDVAKHFTCQNPVFAVEMYLLYRVCCDN